MTKYIKCLHETNGVILLDDNLLSLMAYFEWANDVGVFGDRTICWDCWCKDSFKPELNNRGERLNGN